MLPQRAGNREDVRARPHRRRRLLRGELPIEPREIIVGASDVAASPSFCQRGIERSKAEPAGRHAATE